ncbi:MAG: TRAP transporter small permease [Candidatus Oceanisphaera merdipullorum]|nr:TRAP transporter small permease [Candidatus Oceanisphaera merdipullorum]
MLKRNVIDIVFEWTAILATAMVMFLVLLQVFYRYVLNNPIGWTQEISVFCTMIIVMLGAAIAFKRGEHISISFFVELLPEKLQKVVTVISNLVSIVFLVTLSYQSWLLSKRAMMQISPTSGIPLGYIILFVTVGMALSALYLLPQVFKPKLHNVEDEALAEINHDK